MSMQKRVHIKILSTSRQPLRIGTLRIEPGELHGVLSIRNFIRAGHNDPPGLFLVGLQWNTPKGVGADYTSVMCITALLPNQQVSRITSRPVPRPWDFATGMTLDHRSEYQFEIQDQPPLRGQWKYTGITPFMYFRESDVLIRLELNTDDSRADRGIIVLEYTLPLDVLLWRKAPRLLPDEVFTEEEPWVDVQELSAPVPDLPTSPVWIEA